MRKGNIEFRWSEVNKLYELVKWQGKICYVVASFRRGKEGYNLETVGDRFFEDHDAWTVGKYALAFLNAIWREEKDGNNKI